jgi:hypothetical protein
MLQVEVLDMQVAIWEVKMAKSGTKGVLEVPNELDLCD